jgi:solute carrier family 25 protein 16
LRSLVSTYYGDFKNVPIPAKLACGAIAGALGQTVAYPLDVVRRRMQTAGYSDGMRPLTARATLPAITEIIKHEGWRALFKGLSINYYKVVPAVSISFTTYEYMLTTLNKNWN